MPLVDWLKKYRPTMNEVDGEYDGPYSTYPEIHSTLYAMGYVFLFYLAVFVYPPVTYLVAVQILRVVYFAHTGRRLDIGGHRIGLPDKYLQQIYDESHYFTPILAGLLVGVGVVLQYALGIDVLGRLYLLTVVF